MVLPVLIGIVLTTAVAVDQRMAWLAVPLGVNALLHVLSGIVMIVWSWPYRKAPRAPLPRAFRVPMIFWGSTFAVAVLWILGSCLSSRSFMQCIPGLFFLK